jgi:hypothetical protein
MQRTNMGRSHQHQFLPACHGFVVAALLQDILYKKTVLCASAIKPFDEIFF